MPEFVKTNSRLSCQLFEFKCTTLKTVVAMAMHGGSLHGLCMYFNNGEVDLILFRVKIKENMNHMYYLNPCTSSFLDMD